MVTSFTKSVSAFEITSSVTGRAPTPTKVHEGVLLALRDGRPSARLATLAGAVLLASGAGHAAGLEPEVQQFHELNATLAQDAQKPRCLEMYKEGKAVLFKGQCLFLLSHFSAAETPLQPDAAVVGTTSEPPAAPATAGARDAHGIRVMAHVGAEVSGLLINHLRESGGNEASHGDGALMADVRVQKDLGGVMKNIFMDLSIVNREAVLDYNEKAQQDYHNDSRFRADGYLDRPQFLGSVGAQFGNGSTQEFQLRAGAFDVAGLAPLRGKPSGYYGTAPYGLTVRYDKGIKFEHAFKDGLGEIIRSSFSIIDGDGVKGQHSVNPDDSRANSYPSFAGGVDIRGVSLFNRIFGVGEGVRKKFEVYGGFTGSRGDTGSFPGEKRVQNDLTRYAGVRANVGGSAIEARGFASAYTRNPAGDGSGKHVPLVHSKGKGVEVALRDWKLVGCDWDFYGNKHSFSNGDSKPDGEFTWGGVRNVKGWTAGANCKNIAGVQHLNVGTEYGSLKPDNAQSIAAGVGTSRQLNLFVRFDANVDGFGLKN